MHGVWQGFDALGDRGYPCPDGHLLSLILQPQIQSTEGSLHGAGSHPDAQTLRRDWRSESQA